MSAPKSLVRGVSCIQDKFTTIETTDAEMTHAPVAAIATDYCNASIPGVAYDA